jgi:hypothetical protein
MIILEVGNDAVTDKLVEEKLVEDVVAEVEPAEGIEGQDDMVCVTCFGERVAESLGLRQVGDPG